MENFEHPFRSKKIRPNRKIEEDSEDSNLSRRDFLKISGAGAIALAGGSLVWKFLEEKNEPKTEESPKSRLRKIPEYTAEQKEIEEENIQSIKEIIDFNKEGNIEFNQETAEALKNYWKKRYREDPNLANSLKEAYKKIGGWDEELRKAFTEAGVPEKFRYLLIPESHGQWRAQSRAGAVGPYQFMPATAKSYGLNKNPHPNIEERQDPIKSAGACADYLKELHRKAQGDWDLALSGYNGGFYWRYLEKDRQEGEKINYEGFLKFLEEKINKIKKEKQAKSEQIEQALSDGTINYQIQKGDSLRKIAFRLRASLDEMQRINNIKDPHKIYAGQTIEIPLNKEKIKEIKKALKKDVEKEFWQEIKGFSENLNYPPKFNAVFELIDENFVSEQDGPQSYKTYTTPEKEGEIYYFQKSDKNIYQLARKFPGISYQDILTANPDLNPAKLKGGEKIFIPAPNTKTTLNNIAKTEGRPLKHLIELNPAIIDPDKEIPGGIELRI